MTKEPKIFKSKTSRLQTDGKGKNSTNYLNESQLLPTNQIIATWRRMKIFISSTFKDMHGENLTITKDAGTHLLVTSIQTPNHLWFKSLMYKISS